MAETVNTNSYKPNLEIFSETLQRLAIDDRDIIAVTSDSRGSGKLAPFGEKFPTDCRGRNCRTKFSGCGSWPGSCGKKVFAVSPACFLTARALEQIKTMCL
jgi:transketolase